MRVPSVLRHSSWDATLVALALVHGALLVTVPSIPLIAIGLWWNANTISHNFIHLPFFRARRLNAAFSTYLTLLLGFPQSLWRARHLAHHAGRDGTPIRWTFTMAREVALVLVLWVAVTLVSPHGFAFVYLPGYLLGLALCQLQGHYEHARGTTSHYGRIYNALFFRDGYHVEHHARPSTHWTRLRRADTARQSAVPAVLRWATGWPLVPAALDALEQLVLRSGALQRFVINRHATAIARCLDQIGPIERVAVIGGGLFPRTALIIRRLLPHVRITIIDKNAKHLARARRLVGPSIETRHMTCDGSTDFEADVVFVPLAFVGDRQEFYRPRSGTRRAATVLVHDWIWRRHGQGAVVSIWLLKRLNLIRPDAVRTVSHLRPQSAA